MAFVTASPVTQYDNAGHLEMYRLRPGGPQGGLCVLRPQWRAADLRHHGEPGRPVHDRRRPRLLRDRRRAGPRGHEQRPGRLRVRRGQAAADHHRHRGDPRAPAAFVSALLNPPGLVGVSADGQDVYFSTYDTLVEPGPQRPLPQVLRRPDRRRVLRSRPAAAVRSGRRVPWRRTARRRRAMPDGTGASLSGGNLAKAKAQASGKAKRHRRRGRRAHRRHHHRVERAERRCAMSVASLDQPEPARAAGRGGRGDWRCRRSAGANTPITAYSALPSTAQAGGHPDVEIHFAVENRVLQHSQSPCNCEDAKDAIVHLPPGFIGNPHATPQCSIAEFSADECPIDSQVGIVERQRVEWIPVQRRRLQHRPAARRRRAARASRSSSSTRPSSPCCPPAPEATTASTPTRPRSSTASSRSRSSGRQLWGVPADPSHDPLRLDQNARSRENCRPTSVNSATRAAASAPTTRTRSSSRASRTSSGSRPSTRTARSLRSSRTRRPATTRSDPRSTSSPTTGEPSHADRAWPQTTGCDQLSFNPSLYAQPTTSADRLGLRDRRQPHGAPAAQPDDPLAVASCAARPSPCPTGFSINPNAADGKTSCTDAEANFGTTLRSPLPGVLEGRQPRRSTAPRCRARSRASSTSASRSPATATGSSSSPTASPPTSSWPAPSRPTRRPGSSRSPSRTCRRAR